MSNPLRSAPSSRHIPCALTYRCTQDVRANLMPPQILPADEYNAELLAHTHPPDWKNPTPAGPSNLVAIGGGTARLISALGTAGLGGKVALIERHLLGGDCLNYGCVPSKALIRAARYMHERREGGRESLASEVYLLGQSLSPKTPDL